MAVDKSFTDHIEQSAYNALADYYSRKEGDPPPGVSCQPVQLAN